MDELAASFERLRPQLLRVAYGTLGGLAEAEAERPCFPLQGAERVARALLSLERKCQRAAHPMRGAPGMINGQLGFVYYEGENLNVLSLTTDAGRIVALDVVRNPEKLRHVRLRDG